MEPQCDAQRACKQRENALLLPALLTGLSVPMLLTTPVGLARREGELGGHPGTMADEWSADTCSPSGPRLR